MPLSKAEQDAEAAARASERQTPVVEVPSEPATDTPVAEAAAPPPAPPSDEPPPPPVKRELLPNDQRRADIAARFRASRNEPPDDGAPDPMRRATEADLPPEFQPQPEPPPPAAEPVDEPEPAVGEPGVPAPPAKHKLKVRGREIEVTEEELFSAARKGLAGDDYLDEAKRKLDEINEYQRTVTAPRDGQPAKPPGVQKTTQAAEETADPAEGSEPPENPYAKLVEAIQFGDPGDAAAQLQTLVNTEATTRSKAALQDERMRNEAVRSQRVLEEFKGQHADLAQDPMARAAIETRLYDLQAEDLRKLGIDDATLPTNPAELSKWHLFYRTEGHTVRDAETLLKTARDDFLTWRGVEKEKPAAPKAEPRIEVSVDRTARRASIPQQPTRTVTPKPNSVVADKPPRSRSDIIQAEIVRRNKLRGLNA